jgi:hypothetical protein
VPTKGRSASRGVVQRLIYLAIDKDNIISTQQDEKRPSGCCSGSQGDHMTPYTALQGQVANAIEGVTLKDAWTNLADTFKVYQTLPGWADSTKWVTNTLFSHVDGLLTTGGDINALQEAVTAMLSLRNQIALTSLPKGGSGNGEGKWAGSLQYQERQFQLGHSPMLTKKEVLEYIWKAFDHSRLNNLQSEDRVNMILKQHAITMADAYPQLNGSVGITAKDIKAHYPKQDWLTYNPK